MIKQIPSKEIKNYIKDNKKCVLIDVRTKEEWVESKPDGEKIGLKTYFLSLQFEGGVLNENFVDQVNENNIEMLKTYDVIQAGVVMLKVDMLQKLNISVDYVDADGD